MSSNQLTLKLFCRYTGVQIGTLNLIHTIGGVSQADNWHESALAHPIFNLSAPELLRFSAKEYDRIIKLEETGAEVDDTNLRISFFALLRKLNCVKQDFPVLPNRHVISQNIKALWELACWYWNLDSARFRFPTYHISLINENAQLENLRHYLETYYGVKDDYERGVKDATEKAKIKAAEEATLALTREWIVPINKKLLWRYIRAHIDDRFAADAEGWIGTIFLGNRQVISDWDEDEINLACEVIESSLPTGNPSNSKVRERLKWIKETWKEERTKFTVVLDDFIEPIFINGHAAKPNDPGPMPRAEEFASKSAFYVAEAKWAIANRAMSNWKARTGT